MTPPLVCVVDASVAVKLDSKSKEVQSPVADRYTQLRSVLLPSYVEFIESHNGWEGDLGDDLGYVVIWNRETIQERWDDYQMAEYLSEHWFAFGSDGGGEMLCFDLRSGTDRVF
jgi:hypothetical protein